MNIREIVKKYLKENDYDGLCAYECGCDIGELMPCDAGWSIDCTPGYKINTPNPDTGDDYKIVPVKPKT